MRKLHNLIQGSQEWHAFRASVDGSASEAAAMLGMSPYKSREALLREKATGIKPEVDGATQQRFNDGHKFEAEMRPHAEAFIDQDLYPATISLEVDSLLLSASCDGLTMDEEIAWEHKTSSARIREHLERGEIPEEHHPQCEQVLLVTGATRLLFDASRGAPEVPGVWYESNPELRARIIEGWKQFKADLANYVPEEIKPVAVAQSVEMLPSIFMRSSGKVSVSHNLSAFESALDIFLADKLMRSPQTDDDFATLKAQVKMLEAAETALDAAGEQILAEIVEFDCAIKKRDALKKLVTSNRIMADKLVKSEEQNRKSEIINAVQKEWAEFVSGIESRLPVNIRLNPIAPDFAGAVKSKRTLSTYRDAARDELARAKGEANILHNHLEHNLEMLNELAADYMFLFRDLQALIVKDKDALEAIAKQRISEHKQAEEARIKEEAERIAAANEEKRKAAEAKAEADRIAAEEKSKADEARAAVISAQPDQVERPAECASSLHDWDAQYGNPAPEATQQPVDRMHVRPSFASRGVRPADRQIINAVAVHFQVSDLVAIRWLKELELFKQT